jgi:hypothetical protein
MTEGGDAFVRGRGARLKCESCGGREWALLPGDNLALLSAQGVGSLVTFGAAVDGVSCAVCGHVRLCLSDRVPNIPQPMTELVETDG